MSRFVAVSYPLQRLSMCTVARARAILATLTVVGLGLYSPYLFISAVFPHPRSPNHNDTVELCGLLSQWHDLGNLLNYADICLTLVLPVVLILSLNACIARNVWRLARTRRDLTNQPHQPVLNGRSVQSATSTGRGVISNQPDFHLNLLPFANFLFLFHKKLILNKFIWI